MNTGSRLAGFRSGFGSFFLSGKFFLSLFESGFFYTKESRIFNCFRIRKGCKVFKSPMSIPIDGLTGRSTGLCSISQAKVTNHFPAGVRRIVQVLILPSIGREV